MLDFVQRPLGELLQSPLHRFDLHRAVSPQGHEGVIATELQHLGYIVVRGKQDDAEFMAATKAVLGVALPTTPMSVLKCLAGVLLWVSPDEWLLICPRAGRDAVLAELTGALSGVFAQVVDNSGGLTTLRLSGSQHQRVLHHLGPYDFARLALNQCVGTVMAKTGVTVIRPDAQCVLLVFRRSFADYTWRLIERAARPYGLCTTATPPHTDQLLGPLTGLPKAPHPSY